MVLVNLSGASYVTIAVSQGVLTITNDDLAQLTIDSASLTEPSSSSATATFTVTLTSPSAQTVTVAYATANGTATAGTDYTATSGTLSFTPGTTTRPINVTALADTARRTQRDVRGEPEQPGQRADRGRPGHRDHRRRRRRRPSISIAMSS